MADGPQKPVYKPKIPYIGPLQGGLQEGKSIFIIGRVLSDCQRFHVNLQCGSDSTADIALHINPRYNNGPAHIVYNSFEKSKWGSEKIKFDSPLLQGQQFVLEILVTKQGYQTSLNGKHIMDFEHHIPITRVNTILVDKMVKVNFIAYQKQMVMPYKKELVNGLKSDKDILVYGILNPDCKRIEINLRHTFGIAFHYLCSFEENAVIRNTFEKGKWGTEERSKGIPLKQGQFFKLKICCKEGQFEVYVNGELAHSYKHRFTNLKAIDILDICGGLQLFCVYI